LGIFSILIYWEEVQNYEKQGRVSGQVEGQGREFDKAGV
jgi:hypothetical protein